MSASSTCTSLTVCNLSLTSARCTGFTRVHGQNDFTYVIDLEWTDERTVSVKRTFSEFQKFHNDLSRLFPELRNSKLCLKTSLRENMASLFSKDNRGLAEKRETQLDIYLYHLLRQPERIRRCNLVLSFFDSRDTDPKPCKSNSPSEKADSGIDLTGENQNLHLNKAEGERTDDFTSNDYYKSASRNSNEIDEDNTDECTDEEYDGDTSETETDDDTYDEDYFLDVGFGELMLQPMGEDGQQSQVPSSPITDGTESSMWCSNLDKFSNILRSSMTNLHTVSDNQQKSYRSLNSRSVSVDALTDSAVVLDEVIEESDSREETSDTESQLTGEDREMVHQCESSEEISCSKAKVKQQYFHSNNSLHSSK